MLVRHYEWAGYDVLAITDHWVRTVEPSTKKLLVIPSTELNAVAATEHDAHVLALGVEADPVARRASSRRSQEVVAWIAENGGVPYLAHTYWSGLRTEQWWDCDGPLGHRGLELGLRARARPRRLVDPLGRGARARAAASSRSRPTTRTIPATTAASPGRGCARRSGRRRRCSTRCARAGSTARPARRSTTSR